MTTKTSARDRLTQALARIDDPAGQGRYTCLTVYRDTAQREAEAADARAAAGQSRGPLDGAIVSIKDLFDVAGEVTRAGSRILAEEGTPAARDAVVVERLRAAGAVIVGKTVTTEFAYFHPGKTRNPHDLARTPGGSSSGSAAAVAAGMVPLAIGTQTNGSVIRPASFCGVFGLKPSHGLVSRAGVLPLSRTLDHVGAFARALPDLALLMDAIAGYDPADPDSRPFAAPQFRAGFAEPPPIPPSFVLVRTPMWEHADAETRAALEELARDLDAREIDAPVDEGAAWEAHRAIMAAEMAFNLGHHVARGEVSPQFRALVEEGRAVTAVQYLAAVRDARRYAVSLAEIFEQYADAILTPATKGAAPDVSTTGDPVFCTFWTLTGLPSLSVPLLQSGDGLPVGVQLVGAAGRDERLLRTAAALIERAG